MVQIKAAVLRDGKEKEIPVEAIVPGDVIILSAGDIIPAYCLILDSKDLFYKELNLGANIGLTSISIRLLLLLRSKLPYPRSRLRPAGKE